MKKESVEFSTKAHCGGLEFSPYLYLNRYVHQEPPLKPNF
ncbi:hypothetical protein MTBBW1_2540001 [Desulfamplus magnetovallimortis]|uniref:Uncharacterized protein n=1 Tax=Desulfamplus magnetovallimortis TaxID=1246637 RepID=A0A1W1HET0_9BACT|nr:hypothetical protein MTBBW1_2540001 [Desulfamplus magnetovallimortis]